MRKCRIYIDQNIVGYLRDWVTDWPLLQQNFEWIYSNTHFSEIRRSGERASSFLSALENLMAQRIEITLNEEFEITDEARIHPFSPVHEQYEQYVETAAHAPAFEKLFLPLLARLNGGDNFEQIKSLQKEFQLQIEKILSAVGLWNSDTSDNVQAHSDNLARFICENLNKTNPLEVLRHGIGTSKGRIGNPKTDNPIKEIWEIISPKLTGITMDQFFGFDAADKQGLNSRSLYLGIVGCYQQLNFLGYRTDKGISDEKLLPNTLSDARHVAHAAFCDAFISEDRRLCAKAKAIYKFKNIQTHVLSIKFNASSKRYEQY